MITSTPKYCHLPLAVKWCVASLTPSDSIAFQIYSPERDKENGKLTVGNNNECLW